MNKNFKKASIFLIAASMATGALAGCGSKKNKHFNSLHGRWKDLDSSYDSI